MADLSHYPKSKNENFMVIDTISVQHPYMIGPKHVGYAADHHGGMLSKYTIEEGEKRGIHCYMKGCNLSYKQHETALLIGCKQELKIDEQVNPELHEYLLAIKEQCEKDGYVGFAFKKV